MKRLFGMILMLFFMFLLAGCDFFGVPETTTTTPPLTSETTTSLPSTTTTLPPTTTSTLPPTTTTTLPSTTQITTTTTASELAMNLSFLYNLGVESGEITGTYEEWLDSIRGEQGLPGEDGREVELRVEGTLFQWRYVGDTDWITLVDLTILAGADGQQVEFQVANGYVQWRLVGSTLWNNLFDMSLIQGTDGLSAYEIYLQYHPDYTRSESQWIDDLINSRLGTEETFVVTFDLQGGSLVDDTYPLVLELPRVSSLTLPEVMRPGYTFMGWFTGFSINDMKVSNYTVFDKDVVLYAVWNVINYNLDYQLDGGVNDERNPHSLSMNQVPFTLYAPTKGNYGFAGWYDNANFDGEPLTTIMNISHDMVLYAKWDAPLVDVVLDQTEVEITIWHISSTFTVEFMEAMKQKYEALYPNVTVNLVSYSSYTDLQQAAFSAASIGQLPNIAMGYTDTMTQFRALGLLEPLDPYANIGFTYEVTDPSSTIYGEIQSTALDWSDFLPSAIAENRQYPDGGLYSFPFSMQTDVITVNRTVLQAHIAEIRAAGISITDNGFLSHTTPLTFEQLVLLQEILVDPNGTNPETMQCQYLLDFDNEVNLFYDLARRWGAGWNATNGTLSFDEDLTLDALVYLNDRFLDNTFVIPMAMNADYGSQNFVYGDICMLAGYVAGVRYNNPAAYGYDSNLAFGVFDLDMIPMPDYNVPGIENSVQSVSQTIVDLGIFSQSTEIEKLYSWLWIKLLTSSEHQALYSLMNGGGYMPIRFSSYQNDVEWPLSTGLSISFANFMSMGSEYWATGGMNNFGENMQYLLLPSMAINVAYSQIDRLLPTPSFPLSEIYQDSWTVRTEADLLIKNIYGDPMTTEEAYALFLQQIGPNRINPPQGIPEVTTIAEGLALGADVYAKYLGMTVIGKLSNGAFFFTDGVDIMYVYIGENDAVVGQVYDITGSLTWYYYAPELIGNTENPIVMEPSEYEVRKVTPTVGTVEEIINGLTIPSDSNRFSYLMVTVTGKVYSDPALGTYTTYLIPSDFNTTYGIMNDGVLAVDAIMIYYRSDVDAISAMNGQVVTVDLLMFGYRTDKMAFYANYFVTENAISDDLEAVNAALNAITIPSEIVENTTLDLPSELYGVSIAYTSTEDTIINSVTGYVDLSNLSGQTVVTITATATRGDVTLSKDFVVTVGVPIVVTTVTTIAEILALGVDVPVTIVDVTVVGIFTNGSFFITDGNDFFFVYNSTLDLSVGNVINLTGSLLYYYATPEFSYSGSAYPLSYEIVEGTPDTYPVVEMSISEIAAIPTATMENPSPYTMYQVTGKVYVDSTLGNYSTYLVPADFDTSEGLWNDPTTRQDWKTPALMIYYQSNMTGFADLNGQVVTVEILSYMWRIDKLVWSVCYFQDTNQIVIVNPLS